MTEHARVPARRGVRILAGSINVGCAALGLCAILAGDAWPPVLVALYASMATILLALPDDSIRGTFEEG